MFRRRVLAVWAAAALLAAQEPDSPVPLRIRGRVHDDHGRPIAGAGILCARAAEVTTVRALAEPQATAGADGAFELLLAPAAIEQAEVLLVAARGRVPLLHPRVQWLAREAPCDAVVDLGDILLPPAVGCSGRVRDSDGKPIAGVRVRAIDQLTPDAPTFGSQAITDARGTFVLPGVFPDAMEITLTADGYYSQRIASVALGNPLEFVLEPSGFVEGIVLDGQGRPRDLPVSLRYEWHQAEEAPVRTVAGRFRLPVRARCRFRVIAGEVMSGSAAQSAVLAGPTSGIEVRFDPPGAGRTLIVRAVAAGTGAPVQPIRADVWWANSELDELTRDYLQWMARRWWPDGVASLAAPEGSGHGVVLAVAQGFGPAFVERVAWEPGKEVVVTLEPEARIEGRVLDAATGEPVAGVYVNCHRAGQRPLDLGFATGATVATGADGAYRFVGLAKDRWRIAAARRDGTAAVHADERLGPGETHSVDLRLPAGVTVAGRVQGLEIGPIWKVHLQRLLSALESATLPPNGALGAWNVAGAVPLAADGTFRCAHRRDGSEQLYVVIPTAPRHGPALRIPAARVRIQREDVEVEVDAAGRRPGAIQGSVAPTGAELPRGRMAVVARGFDKGLFGALDQQLIRRQWALVGADGSYSLPTLPGEHRVEVVDIVTGVTLLRVADPVDVAAGKASRLDLAVEVVEAIASVAVAGGGPHYVDWIDVGTRWSADGDWEPSCFGGGMYRMPGVGLDGSANEVRFFVPPGTVQLAVPTGATWLGLGGTTAGGPPRAQATFAAELGTVARVELIVTPPPDLGRK